MFPAPAAKAPPPLPSAEPTANLETEANVGLPAVDQTVGAPLAGDATIPSASEARKHLESEALSETPENVVAAAPVQASDTLQYASPDVSEPGLDLAASVLGPHGAQSVQAMTEDIADSAEMDPPPMTTVVESVSLSGADSMDTEAAAEEAPVISTEAYPPVAPAKNVHDEKTELMDAQDVLAGHERLPSAAPIGDVATRKIIQDDDFGARSSARSHAQKIDSDAAPEPSVSMDGSSIESVDFIAADVSDSLPSMIPEVLEPDTDGDSESIAPEFIAPESIAPESIAPESIAPESVAPESVAPESVAPVPSISFSDDVVQLDTAARPAVKSEAPRQATVEPVVTERRDGPRSRGDKGPVSPGLIVAACIIFMAAIFSVVYHVSKKSPAPSEVAKTKAVALKAMDAQLAQRLLDVGVPETAVANTEIATEPQAKDVGVPPVSARLKIVASAKQAKKTLTKKTARRVDKERLEKQEPQTLADMEPVDFDDDDGSAMAGVKRGPTRKAVSSKNAARKPKKKSRRVVDSAKRTKKKPSAVARRKSTVSTTRNFMMAKGSTSTVRDPTENLGSKGVEKRAARGLSAAAVSAVVGKYGSAISGCYTRHLRRDPTFNPGRLMLQFEIRPSGLTSKVRIMKRNRRPLETGRLTKCLKRLVKRWRFPHFVGEPFYTEYPLVFQKGL
jgi:hypothetical protein